MTDLIACDYKSWIAYSTSLGTFLRTFEDYDLEVQRSGIKEAPANFLLNYEIIGFKLL